MRDIRGLGRAPPDPVAMKTKQHAPIQLRKFLDKLDVSFVSTWFLQDRETCRFLYKIDFYPFFTLVLDALVWICGSDALFLDVASWFSGRSFAGYILVSVKS